MNARIYGTLAAVVILLGVGAVATGTFSGLDFSGDNCDWQDVEVNGETYTGVSEFEAAWNTADTDREWSFVQDRLDFRTSDGVLQYRSCVEVNN